MKIALLAALLVSAVFARAQPQTGLDCSRARHCEMREQAASASGRFAVEDLHNGSVTSRGANRNDVLVRMRVETDAHSAAKPRTSSAVSTPTLRPDVLQSMAQPRMDPSTGSSGPAGA